ncbi:MAG: HAD family hydrolase [Candidatus Goldiibacteriota bacterium]
MKIKTVFFDAGETLVYRNPSLAGITFSYIKRAGSGIEYKDLNRIMAAAALEMKTILERAKHTDGERWQIYMKKVFKKAGIKDNELLCEIKNRLKKGTSFRKYRDVLPVIAMLRKRKIKPVVISNAPYELYDILKRVKLYNEFDGIIVSEEAGFEKPDKRIFLNALKKTGAKASESIYVGDNYIADVMGARGAGIRPVWLLRDTDNVQFTYKRARTGDNAAVIKKLTELEALL